MAVLKGISGVFCCLVSFAPILAVVFTPCAARAVWHFLHREKVLRLIGGLGVILLTIAASALWVWFNLRLYGWLVVLLRPVINWCLG